MTIEKNMGLADRIIRPTLAAAIVTAYASSKVKGATGIGLLALATVFTITSTVGWCPLYQALGIDTIADDK